MTEQRVIGIVYNDRVPEAKNLAQELMGKYGTNKESWISPGTKLLDSKFSLESTSAIVTAGGDGTILQVAHLIAPYKIPIIGVNFGRVGFLTELEPHEAMSELQTYLSQAEEGNDIEERSMLLVEAYRGQNGQNIPDATFHALNDVVVARGANPQLINIEASVSEIPLTTYAADAVIVSTATGSTGYNLAARGPILHPKSKDILLTPVAPHLSFNIPMILSETSTITLAIKKNQAVLSVDGISEIDLGTSSGMSNYVSIRNSPYTTEFVRGDISRFYARLTNYLNLNFYANLVEKSTPDPD